MATAAKLPSRRRGKATERVRDYKVWTKEEDKAFIYNLQKLAREKYIENGSFQPGGYKEVERLMNIDVPGCNIRVDPHIKSRFRWWKEKFVAQIDLRNSSGMGWDDARGCVSMEEGKFAEWVTEELCEIFGESRAVGTDAVQAGDAVKVMENNNVIDDVMEEDSTGFEGYDFCGVQPNRTQEDFLNAGYDIHATGLKEAEAQSITQAKGKSSTSSSGQKRTRQQANEDLLSSIDGKMDKMTETIAETAHNIARMANTFCIHDDTTMKQKMLYAEMEKFSELTRIQKMKAMRFFTKDEGEAAAFFQLQTDEEKLEFILNFVV
ncbi:hypothetical protein LINPERPRIM_LOCUS20223 [Linum perenne]